MKLNKLHISILFFIFINLSFYQISLFFWLNQNNYDFFSNTDLKNPENIYASAQETFTTNWLENPTFDDPIEPVWYSKEEGDTSDVKATAGLGHANLSVIGDQGTFSEISGIPTSDDWLNVTNPGFPLYPDIYTIETYGCRVYHHWRDGDADQSTSVHWERNVSLPVNMEDYIITSASLSAVVNATVSANNGGGGGIEVPGDPVDDASTYDYVKFYVLLSDLAKNKVYEIAYNQTIDLGKDSVGATDYMPDTFMNIVSEEVLIFFLSSVLSTDNHNFTITLGIRIWCEDNWVSDQDRWDELLIKSCNLTFTYERKIDQFTSVSWNQNAGKISDLSNGNIIVNEAKLNFKYKIDQTWPSYLSPNSEIKILINENPHAESIKLSSANTSFQEAKVGGFNVTSLITDDVNLSIQLFLADDFRLDKNITISIDDVFLNITYTVTVDTTAPEISIIYPLVDQGFSEPPAYILSITEENIAAMWYTLNGGSNNPIASETGTIDPSAWNSLANGPVTIRFYVRDIADQEAFEDVIVVKVAVEVPPLPPVIPSYNLISLIGVTLAVTLILAKRKLKK